MFPAASWLLLAQEGNGGGGSMFGMWVPFLMIGILFYFLLIRPERRRRAETVSMLDLIKKNDRIVTIGGIFGTVVNVQKGSEEVTIRVDESSNTRLRILRSAISRVITPEKEEKNDAGA